MIEIKPEEVRRYLGDRNQEFDPSLQQIIAQESEKLMQVIRPRSIYMFFPLKCEKDTFYIENIRFQSRALSRNLKGCTAIVLMACTLGMETDQLIQRTQFSSLLRGSVLQAAATAAIESYCDEVNEEIRLEASNRHLFLRPRFSPGYGDLSLSHQKDFFQLMPVSRETGITLLDSLLMVPSKSVTALIGLSPIDQNCILTGCESCSMNQTCMYSRMEDFK